MNKKITKKILAIFMVITILATDFVVLGSNLITYAAQLNSETNNDNIEFSVYFKDGGNKVASTQTSIKNTDLKLYAEIKVKNEGYLQEGAKIKIENSNFNLKDEILSTNTHIANIESNVVNLKQVTNGETIEIELAIEPIIKENITSDFLSKTSTVKMNGIYIYSQQEAGATIETEKQVCVNYQPDETTGAELETDIITNKVLSVNGTNKRIVQVLVKSRLTNNEYPVKQTLLNVGIPQLSGTPEVNVLATGKLATNGNTEISTENWAVENGTVKITLNNDADGNNQINWSKNVYDEIVVTYIYPETVNASTIEITTNLEIKVHNAEDTYTARDTKAITNQELSNVIIGKTEITTEEIYKGKIYSNIDQEYNTKTSIVVTNANIVDEIVVTDGEDAFGTAESELPVNTKYLTTELNLAKMLAILGQDGSLQIKNGEKLTVINKNSQVNESGNVVINHENSSNKIEIKTSKPVAEGVLELNHAKVITGNSYSKEELETVKTLKAKNSLVATSTLINKVSIFDDTATWKWSYVNGQYGMFVPTKINEYESVPLIVWLHGLNEEMLSSAGVHVFGTWESRGVNAFILCPESPDTEYEWVYPDSDRLMNLINQIINKYPIDPNNIIIAGGSAGAVGAITMAENSPQYFSKVVVLAGMSNTSKTTTIPIKCYVGTEDQQFVDYMNTTLIPKYGRENCYFINGADHYDIVSRAFQEDNGKHVGIAGNGCSDLMEWIFEGVELNKKTNESKKQNVVKKSTETSIELKETITKAEMTIDKTTLSTTAENEVNIGIKLITDGTNYDLYSNPTIKLRLPSDVENVEFIDEPSKLYADGFTAINQSYDKENKIVTVSLTGAQTEYPETALTQTYIQISMKITLAEQTTSKTDIIKMLYTNKNANQYYGETTDAGLIKQSIEISAQPGLWKMFNLSSSENTSEVQTIKQQIAENLLGKTLTFETKLVNNIGSNMSNVKIIGKLPTTGNTIKEQKENTLETNLTSIEAENATIYYTENVNATADTENTQNGWTTELATLTNAKMYLIKLEELVQGANYVAKVNVNIPNTVGEGLESYTQYEVIYDTNTNTDVNEVSRKIALVTYVVSNIEVSVTGNVGEDTLKEGDKVKEGEVIKYTVTVKNNGNQTFENLQLNLDVPKGTAYVSSKLTYDEENGTYVEIAEDEYVDMYYEEIKEGETLKGLTEITIPEILAQNTYTTEYEVRVNKGSAGTDISNQTTVKYNESTIKCEEEKYKVEEANVRVTIKRILSEMIEIYPDTESRYTVFVENLSNSTIKDLELEIISEGFMILNEEDNTERSNKIKIDEIPPKDDKNEGMVGFEIYGIVMKNVDEMSISAVVKDFKGEKYRSNKLSALVPYIDGTITMTSPQDGKSIKEGDLIEYNIIAKNTGDVEAVFNIIGELASQLQVQSIYVNKELKIQNSLEESISNDINYGVKLKPQEQIEVDIIAKVGYIQEIHHGKAISFRACLKGININENSKVITHILKASSKVNEDMENIISGLAWLDINPNGQRDAYEKFASGVKVKLYNTKDNCYVSDEKGNVIEMLTDDNGEYNFTKIKDGSYLIIFEYDTEKYEFTTSYAEGVDTTLNSKATLKRIETDETIIRVAAIELNNLNKNVFNMNIGLKENTGDTPIEEQPGITDKTETPDDPQQPENPDGPDNPENSEGSEKPQDLKTINGFAWLDSDRDGKKDENEKSLEGIKVSLYDITIKDYLKDSNGNNIETKTDAKGKYTFNNIEKGSYIVIFEYDTNEYEPTTYLAQGVNTKQNSKVVLKKININGQEKLVAVTDTINVQDNVSNINIGLKEKLIFDLELNKYISRVIVQNSKETKAYDYEEKSLAKVEINKKRLPGSLVIIEYTIKVKNTGEIAGYVKNIVDYLPTGLTFSSELNQDWYLLDNNLYAKSLENVELKPGEEKEIKILLTKTMTNENTGLINNRAEIYQDYNSFGEADIDSTPNNQVQNEDDMSSADVIIGIATGGRNITYIVLLMINIILIVVAIRIMIKNDIIKISITRERR